MRYCLSLIAFCVSLISPTLLRAQNYLYATGTPTYSSVIPVDHGFINVNNGELHLEFPLASTAQRGDQILDEKLVYDSRIWKIVQNGSSYGWQPTNINGAVGGWSFSSGEGAGTITYSLNSGSDPHSPGCNGATASAQSYYEYRGWVWTDPNHTTHLFPADTIQYYGTSAHCLTVPPGTPTSTAYASDGSGYSLTVTNYTTPTIQDQFGMTYHPTLSGTNYPASGSSPIVTDRNGNYWTVDSNGNLVDTSNQTPVLVSSSGNQTYYDVLAVGGGRNRYTVTTTQVAYNTEFTQQAVNETSGSFTAIQSIGLPDGTSYQFTYDSGTSTGHFGELASMTLPSGGVISYIYTPFLDSYNNQNRWIFHLVKDGGTTIFRPTVISTCSSTAGCQESITVTSPDSNDTAYQFSLDKSQQLGGASWEQSVIKYKGTGTSRTAVRGSSTSYTYNNMNFTEDQNGTTSVTNTVLVPATIKQTLALLDSAVSSQVITTLSGFTPVPSDVKIWDYSPSSATPPAQPTIDTAYTYAQGGAPASITVTDGSGNLIGKTTYVYDEGTPTGTSTPNHTTGVNSRNLTTQKQWIDAAGDTLNTTFTYFDTGKTKTVTNGSGTTSLAYDSTGRFVTTTSYPTPSSGVALSTADSFDPYTGVPLSSSDANGATRSYLSYDTVNRPGEINVKDSTGTLTERTTYTYTPLQMSTFAYRSTGVYLDTETALDSYGRLSRSATANGQSSNPWYQTDTCYDANGRISFTSTPYQASGFANPKVCSGSAGTTVTYDALDRVLTSADPDGTLQMTYQGRSIQSTDPNGVKRIVQKDVFGETTAVCELSANSAMPQSGSPSSCGLDYPGTGFVTTYLHNRPAHQLSVTQGSQQRSFQKDLVGREIKDVEPERGETDYSYSFNSTGLTQVRKRGQANVQAGAAAAFTNTTTQFDSVGRVVSVAYSDGTPTKSFSFDKTSTFTESGAQTNLKGRLSMQSVVTPYGNAATIYAYDGSGRVTKTYSCLPSGCGTASLDRGVSYGYDWLGSILSESDGAGNTYTYNRTVAGEVTGIMASPSDATHPANIVAPNSVQNSAYGPLQWTLGNGVNQLRVYDTLGRISQGYTCGGSSTPSCGGGTQFYGFIASWRGQEVTSATDTVLNRGGTFGYDEFGRLTSGTTSAGVTQNQTWSYDRWGNRSQQTESPSGPQPSLSFSTATNQVAGSSYDQAGNLLYDGLHHYSFDAEGNVLTVDSTSATYSYDALNQRIRIATQSRGTTETVFDASGNKVSTWNAPAETLNEANVYWDGRPVAFRAGGSTHFEHQDWIGTERLRMTYSGTQDATYTSLPFGDAYTENGNDWDWYHLAGMSYDPESGSDNAQYRQYSSLQGRWLSPDPDSDSYDLDNPQSLNRYSYVLNEPISGVDPAGLDGTAGQGNSIIVALIADAITGISYALDELFRPRFKGTTQSRPGGIWDEHQFPTFHPTPYSSLGSLIGGTGSGCEFGACGNSFAQTDGTGKPQPTILSGAVQIPVLFGGIVSLQIPFLYQPKTNFRCIGAGPALSTPGKYVNGGVGTSESIAGGDVNKIAPGWSWSLNVQGNYIFGVGVSGNSSGAVKSYSIGAPGASFSRTYSWCWGRGE